MVRAGPGADGQRRGWIGGRQLGDAGIKKEKAKDGPRSPEDRAWPPGSAAWPPEGGARLPGMGPDFLRADPGLLGSVQFSLVTQSCPSLCDPWTAARQGSLSITNSRSSPKLMSIKLVMPSSHLILCRPLLLLTSVFPSIRVFSNESALRIRWPKYWSFSFIISPSNEDSGLISFRMDRLDLLVVQGTLKESSPAPQFKSINSSALNSGPSRGVVGLLEVRPHFLGAVPCSLRWSLGAGPGC